MALDVKVKIELSKTTGSKGFGIPLLLELAGSDGADVAYTECYSIDDVVAAGFAAETDMYKAASMVFMQNNRPAKIAVASTTKDCKTYLADVINKDWRQLVLVVEKNDTFGGTLETLGTYIEQTNKMLFVSAAHNTICAYANGFSSGDRVVLFANSTPHADAALVGETAGRAAGSFTYKNKTLKGVVAETYTEADLEELHGFGAFAYVTKAGDDVTTEGIAASGKYIDITDSIDYVVQNIEYRIQKVFNTTAKVPYDNRGIALLEAATTFALQDAFNNGIIATKEDGVTPDFSVSFAPRSETTAADREAREYKCGSFRFALAGAIHGCEVYGEVTY